MDLLGKIAMAFEHGGFWMYPIFLIQIVTIAIIVERVHALYFKRKLNQIAYVKGFEETIRRGKVEEASIAAKNQVDQYPVASAITAGATAALGFGGKDEIQGKMDEALLFETGKIEKRTAFLAVLGNVATLLGLLGTITGMIKSFAAVADANPTAKAALLSNGISEAMNCTAYGLIVAIPALLAYAILQNRSNEMLEDLNQSALKVYNWLSYSFDSMASRPVVSAKSERAHSADMNA